MFGHTRSPRSSLGPVVGPALWRQTAESYVQDCFARRTSPRVKELAAHLRLSRDQLSRAFLASTGGPLSTIFILAQLEESKRMLDETDMPVAAIAKLSGFENTRTFERFFKRLTSQTATEYRERAPNVARFVLPSFG